MDVAKYIATAVLLTQIFGGMADSTYIIIYALMSVVIIFALGVSIFEIAIHLVPPEGRRYGRPLAALILCL